MKWHGQMTGKGEARPSSDDFLNFLAHRSVDMEMHVLKPVIPDYDDSDIEARRAFSNAMYERMAEVLEKHEKDFDQGPQSLSHARRPACFRERGMKRS
ncbi:MAG: hypothetical protein U5N26_05895 [Candidatus Marinimicrobia bacterium]|nr:hypothetical protein [Candidatus Neomarinimicrobiota bacterium]